VTLHVPLTESTHHLMTTRTFGLMKPSAVLINTCRGPVVDEIALHHALGSGQIAAAGLDVMMEEPPAVKHALFGLENVIITPHMAGPTWENWPRAFRNSYDNIQRVAAGRPPLWVIPELRA
jgi:phosphoglycerate dehydrogenase-like enzyme